MNARIPSKLKPRPVSTSLLAHETLRIHQNTALRVLPPTPSHQSRRGLVTCVVNLARQQVNAGWAINVPGDAYTNFGVHHGKYLGGAWSGGWEEPSNPARVSRPKFNFKKTGSPHKGTCRFGHNAVQPAVLYFRGSDFCDFAPSPLSPVQNYQAHSCVRQPRRNSTVLPEQLKRPSKKA